MEPNINKKDLYYKQLLNPDNSKNIRVYVRGLGPHFKNLIKVVEKSATSKWSKPEIINEQYHHTNKIYNGPRKNTLTLAEVVAGVLKEADSE